MKILYLANIRLPSEKGETQQIMKMADAMVQNGHEVELVVPKRRNIQFKDIDPFSFYNLKNKFDIKKLYTIDLVSWQNIFGSFAFKLQYWIFSRRAANYATRANPEIIYSRDWRTLRLLASHKENLIFELHEFREKDVEAYKSIEQACLKIVVISEGLKRKLIESGIPEEKILVAPDSVDIEEFDLKITPPKARAKLDLPQDINLIIYVGGLYKWKGIYTLIDGFKLFCEKYKDTKLVLVGGTEKNVQEVNDYLLENEVSNILVKGFRPYVEVPYYLKAADVLMITDSGLEDISREYTSPLKLFQSMAAQRVIVASKTPALQEILSNENAWFFTPDNAESLAFVLANALEDTPASQKKAQQAWEDVQEFTWVKRAKNIIG